MPEKSHNFLNKKSTCNKGIVMFDRPNLSADAFLRHRLSNCPSRRLAPTLLAAAIATVLAFPVAAQETQEPEVIEELIVTGYRQSILNAIDAKRLADTVSETLSADDLGALPDVSMADALTRLPGISAVRTGGQAGEINIRGMAGGFVFTTLNGREQVSPSGSRSIEFDQYPSELISEASVYKSPKSSLIEGGVAGTVELKTASPLRNRENHKVAFNLRGMLNDRADEVSDAEEFGHRISVSYQGKFADDTIGCRLCAPVPTQCGDSVRRPGL
jgi:outer membrane receptor protein involved in Fe transport